MCHCIFFRINPRVSKHHAFRLHRATVYIHQKTRADNTQNYTQINRLFVVVKKKMYFLATSRSTFAQMYNCSDASAIYGGFCIIGISLTYVFTPTALDDSSSLITLHFRTQLSNVSELMKTFCTEKHTTKCKNNEDVSTTKLLRTVLSSEKRKERHSISQTH